jgi:hypothetical protein
VSVRPYAQQLVDESLAHIRYASEIDVHSVEAATSPIRTQLSALSISPPQNLYLHCRVQGYIYSAGVGFVESALTKPTKQLTTVLRTTGEASLAKLLATEPRALTQSV